MQYRLVKRKEFEMELCLREENVCRLLFAHKNVDLLLSRAIKYLRNQVFLFNQMSEVLTRILQYFNH